MIDATMEKSLLLLPDDALLAVLAFLRPRRLMALRVLCRRLRDVCLHPDLWRRVSLSSTRQRGLLLAALRLAPCLRSLTIQSVDPVLADGLLNTRCAIAKLHMPVEVAVEASEAWAETVVQHLHSVGGVSSLSVFLRGTPVENASPLLRVICGMDGLAELSIFINNNETLSVPVDSPVPKPSLTQLHYASRAMDPFLVMLLEAHRSTLQTVLVATTSFPGSDSLPKLVPFPADLFNAMPQLRILWCPPDEALSQLQALPLDGVILAGGFDTQPFPQGALEFLRQAPRLSSVKLRLSKVDPATPVQALGQARSAGLINKLSLKFAPGHLDEVAAVWPRLPSLRTLSVDAKPTDSFLRALSPASVPSLTSLNVPCFEPCAHEWLHSPAVQDVLVRNQQLHLRISVTAGATEDCRCWWCVKGCHSELTPHSPIVCSSFSAHSKAPGCPDTCFQIAVPLCPRCEPRN